MVGNKLKEIGTMENMSEQFLAKKVSVSKQTVLSIESGRYSSSVVLALKLASALDVKITNCFIIMIIDSIYTIFIISTHDDGFVLSAYFLFY